MPPSQPYLVRAIYEWIVDNELTPYVLVNAEDEGAVVPNQFVEDGRIVLNIGPTAVRDLDLGNEMIYFNARFGGVAMDVMLPPEAVLGIYARENGRGMLFPDEEPEDPDSPEDGGGQQATGRPSLKVVK